MSKKCGNHPGFHLSEDLPALKSASDSSSRLNSPSTAKISIAYVMRGECVLRYDNEVGEGDHRHFGKKESAYAFCYTGSIDRRLPEGYCEVEP